MSGKENDSPIIMIKPVPKNTCIMDYAEIETTDWRQYVQASLQTMTEAVNKLIDMFDDDVQKKVKIVNEMRGAWQRVIGEADNNTKRYQLFGMRVKKMLDVLPGEKEDGDEDEAIKTR